MLELTEITVRFGSTIALDNVSLSIKDGERVAILGPSGSGKSTLLRVIAGLVTPESPGTVCLAGRDITHMSTHKRHVGLMFQDHVLFPHLDVAHNVAFGLKMHGVRHAFRQARVAELLNLVGLDDLSKRAINTLSGGQQQRVALARALAITPDLLLLDEPFGQLDRPLTERLVADLKEIFAEIGLTTLAVIHDRNDAFTLSHRIAIMQAGKIVQIGTPEEVWQYPNSTFVARFLGFSNITSAVITGQIAQTPWGPLLLRQEMPAGEYDLLVRPHGIIFDQLGELETAITARIFRGAHTVLHLRPANGPTLEAMLPAGQPSPEASTVRIRFDPEQIVLFPRDEHPLPIPVAE